MYKTVWLAKFIRNLIFQNQQAWLATACNGVCNQAVNKPVAPCNPVIHAWQRLATACKGLYT